MPITQTRAISPDPSHSPRAGRRAGAAREVPAVVAIVRVIGTVVDEVNATVVGLKLQLLSVGKFEHIADERVAEPVKPF